MTRPIMPGRSSEYAASSRAEKGDRMPEKAAADEPEVWMDVPDDHPGYAPTLDKAAPEPTVEVPQRWVDEVVLALDAATTIGIRSCNSGDGLHIGNHDRLIREAQQWSVFARSARSLPNEDGRRG